MLEKRTNILFDRKLWESLLILARQHGVSVGQLIRDAVKKTYFSEGKDEKISRAFESILANRKKFKSLNYRELIEYGRK